MQYEKSPCLKNKNSILGSEGYKVNLVSLKMFSACRLCVCAGMSTVLTKSENVSKVEASCLVTIPCALLGNTMTQPEQIDFACDQADWEMK